MVLSDDNFILYAMHHYTVPSCPTLEEFGNDLRIFTYVKKHISKQKINTKLLLNHIITLFNCFGEKARDMLFFKVDREHWGTLVTFLLYLSRMPEYIPEYDLHLYDVKLNEEVIEELRNI